MKTRKPRERYFKSSTKSHDIIALWQSGVINKTEIARRVGCTSVNVHKTLKRHAPAYTTSLRRMNFNVHGLPDDQIEWLEAEASRSGVTPEVMARALLIDAIEEARQGK